MYLVHCILFYGNQKLHLELSRFITGSKLDETENLTFFFAYDDIV